MREGKAKTVQRKTLRMKWINSPHPITTTGRHRDCDAMGCGCWEKFSTPKQKSKPTHISKNFPPKRADNIRASPTSFHPSLVPRFWRQNGLPFAVSEISTIWWAIQSENRCALVPRWLTHNVFSPPTRRWGMGANGRKLSTWRRFQPGVFWVVSCQAHHQGACAFPRGVLCRVDREKVVVRSY